MAHRPILNLTNISSLVILCLGGCFICYSIISLEPVQKLMISSDQLTIISLADDIIHNPHFSPFLWNFPRAPYFFPDLLASLGLSTIVHGDARIAIIMLLMQSVFIVAMGFLLCLRLERSVERGMGIAAAFGSIVILYCIGARHGWYPDAVIWPFISYAHASALDLTLLGFVALVTDRYASPRHIFWMAASTLFTMLAYVSDKTAIVLFLSPALVYTTLRPRGRRFLALTLFTSVQLTALCAMWTVDHVFYFQRMENNALEAVPMHLIYLIHLFSAQRISLKVVIFLSAASTIFVLIRSLIRIGRFRESAPFDEDGVTFLLATSSLLNAMLCIWLWSAEEPGFARYAVMIEFASPILLAFCAARLTLLRARSPGAIGLSVLASMLVAGVIAWQGPRDPFAAFSMQQARAQEIKTCVKEHNLHSGFAAYWTARQLSSSTNWEIQIDQFEPGQSLPFFWGSDLIWFFEHLNGGQLAQRDFIVLNDLSSDDVFARYGLSDEIVECGHYRLAIYRTPARLESRVLRSLASTVTVQTVRDHLPPSLVADLDASRLNFDVDDLRSLVGHREPGSISLSADDNPGYALYGPYVTLAPGRYGVDVTFRCTARTEGSFFEVAAGDQHSKLVDWQIGIHPDVCDGHDQHARLSFVADRPLSLVEIRAFYGGRGDLTITGVHLNEEPST